MNMLDQIDTIIIRAIEREGELDNVAEATLDILALIRERLTSEAAVEAGLAASYLTPPDVDWTAGERRCMSNALTAALDAITGETR
ncbi:MAG TPA: hypothetical protein VM450_17720 [Thermomicrobiales bacterium]|nr:hypothetical protein [Thermomicrobiales bacterium]